ncbi:hypothetical protein, partial [Staphylococcus aureus]|uniref:hypothetical protein n=1 Tax=Staphylococcus aureus TaxID=1280 RepID=UPI0038B2ADCE
APNREGALQVDELTAGAVFLHQCLPIEHCVTVAAPALDVDLFRPVILKLSMPREFSPEVPK